MTHLWISVHTRGYLEIHTGTAEEAAAAERKRICVPITIYNAETWIAVLSELIGNINAAQMQLDDEDVNLDRKSAASLEDFPSEKAAVNLFTGKLIERHYQDAYLMFLRKLLAAWCEVYTTMMGNGKD